jgi:hypothetical protein
MQGNFACGEHAVVEVGQVTVGVENHRKIGQRPFTAPCTSTGRSWIAVLYGRGNRSAPRSCSHSGKLWNIRLSSLQHSATLFETTRPYLHKTNNDFSHHNKARKSRSNYPTSLEGEKTSSSVAGRRALLRYTRRFYRSKGKQQRHDYNLLGVFGRGTQYNLYKNKSKILMVLESSRYLNSKYLWFVSRQGASLYLQSNSLPSS